MAVKKVNDNIIAKQALKTLHPLRFPLGHHNAACFFSIIRLITTTQWLYRTAYKLMNYESKGRAEATRTSTTGHHG